MTETKKRVKLLVKVSDKSGVMAAIAGGADAVILNKCEDFEASVGYSKLFNTETFLVVDELPTNLELENTLAFISQAISYGIDGIIVADIGLFRILTDNCNTPIYLSSETALRNSDSIAKVADASGIFLSLELSRDEICDIRKVTDAQLGLTVHGDIGAGALARRNCKLKIYTKELCLIKQLADIVGIGVDNIVLSCEKKSPYLTFIVTEIYKKGIMSILSGAFEITEEMQDDLILASDSELTEGYYLKKKDIASERKYHKKGVPAGIIANGSVKLICTLGKGEQIAIQCGRKYANFKINYMFSKGEKIEYANPGDTINLKFPHFSNGSRVYKMSMHEKTVNFSRIPIKIAVKLAVDKPMTIKLSAGKVDVTVKSTTLVEKAHNQPLNESSIREQIGRVNDKPFSIEKLDITMHKDSIIAYSEINKIKHEGFIALYEALLKSHKKDYQLISVPSCKTAATNQTPRMYVRVYDMDGLVEAVEAKADLVYYDIFAPDVMDAQEYCKKKGVPIYLVTPRIIHERELVHIVKLVSHYNPEGILVGNPALLSPKIRACKHIDYNFNIANEHSLAFWKLPSLASVFLNREELVAMSSNELIAHVHGRIVVMNTRYEIATSTFEGHKSIFEIQKTPYGDTLVVEIRERKLLHYMRALFDSGIRTYFLDIREEVASTILKYREALDEKSRTAAQKECQHSSAEEGVF